MSEATHTVDLKKRILRYSAAASLAASGGLLLATSPAAAGSVSNPVTDCDFTLPAGGVCDIDFDGNLDPEFTLSFFSSSSEPGLYMTADTSGADQGIGFVVAGSNIEPAVLSYNNIISAGRTDWTTYGFGVLLGTLGSGNWAPPHGHASDPTQGAYVGVNFHLNGTTDVYHGWVELHFPDANHVTVLRTGYNDVPGSPIPAAVSLQSVQATSGIGAIAAAVVTTVAGASAWLKRRFARN